MVLVAGSILESRSRNSSSRYGKASNGNSTYKPTHITAKFASIVSHRRFCYIYLA